MSVIVKRKEVVFAFWARKDSTGVYPHGSTGAISNGSGAMMTRANGFTSLEVTQNEPAIITNVADGGIFDSYRVNPTEPVRATFGTIALDTDLSSNALNTTLYTEGEHEVELVSNDCLEFNDLVVVVNSRADLYNASTGIWTRNVWWVDEYINVTAFPLTPSSGGDPSVAPATFQYALVMNDISKTLAGETITSGNYGRGKGYARRYKSANPVIWGTFVGDASATTFAIDSAYDPVAEAASAIQVWDDGTEQAYTTDFTLSDQTLTFVAAPAAGSIHPFKLEFDGSNC